MEPSPIANGIAEAVGNTPLVKLQHIVPAGSADVFVKIEYFNPTGSYKDRMALAIVNEAEKRGDIKPDTIIVECTGGSTGTSLAWVCAARGYRFKVVSSDAFSEEKLQTMRLFGADLEVVPSQGGRITPDLIPGMIARATEISKQPGHYYTNQFNNEDALIGYRQLGDEIVAQLGNKVSAFCAASGTGGMVTGVSQALKAANANTKVVVLEPASSPILSQGIKGSHTVEGTSPGFFPPLLKKAVYDEVWPIDEQEGRNMARLLASKEGIFAGISSGLNVVAALRLAQQLGPGHNVVTVAVDSGMKYLSGGLYR